jgi:kynureninase
VAARLTPGFIGWAAHSTPFAFETGPAALAEPPERFQSGTPNIPALYAARAGYEIICEIGVEAIRVRSLRLTRLLIERAQAAGFRLNTPLDDSQRAGAVIIDVPDGEAVSQQLILQGVIVDYRPGAGIRIAPHFYNTEQEIDRAMNIMVEITSSRGGNLEKTTPK